jgi:hypothetical protein
MNVLSWEGSWEKAGNGWERDRSHNDRPSVSLEELVVARLEDAGRVLLTLPVRGHSTHLRTGHPEVVHGAIEAYGWHTATPRPALPSAERISKMDEALSWISLIPVTRVALRRVIGRRMLVHPLNDRHLYSWRKIGRELGISHHTAESWHGDGVGMIAVALRIKFSV